MSRLVDLSHTVRHGLVTYRGLPAPEITDHLTREASREHYQAGTEFHIGRISMVANTGTYLDAPFHRFPEGKDLAALPLESLADLPGILVDATGGVKEWQFTDLDLRGKAVLVRTDWSRHWDTDAYHEGHPFLTRAMAERLRDGGAALVGIDSFNIDDTSGGERPVHTVLLKADIPVVEHMTNLGSLPATGFRLSAVPVKVEAFGTFPVRAFAIIED